MQNKNFRFQPDQPTIIRLKYRTGKPFTMGKVSGFTYTLDTGLITRFPESADKEIQAFHLDAGQPFQVTKRMLTTGEFAWDIERVEGKPGQPTQTHGRSRLTEQSTPELTNRSVNVDQKHTTELPPAILTTEHGRTILRQLIGMVEIVNAAENYAKRIGRPIHFSPTDIRSLAISCFIQQSHEAIERDRLEAVRVA